MESKLRSWKMCVYTISSLLISFFGTNILLAIMVNLWDEANKKESLINLKQLNYQILDVELLMIWRRNVQKPKHFLYAEYAKPEKKKEKKEDTLAL